MRKTNEKSTQHRRQPIERQIEPLGGACEAESEIALADRAERSAGRETDLAAPNDVLGKVEAVAHPVDAEEGVKRPLGRYGMDAGEALQARHDDVAPGAAALDH